MTAPDFWTRALALARSLDRRSYYALLEVTTESSADEVRAAYARLVSDFHPDRHGQERDPDRRRALVSIQARLNEAYRVLADAGRRAAYDHALTEGQIRLVERERTPAAARSQPMVAPRARLYFDAGQECERAGDLAGARTQYGLAVQVDPESAAIRDAIARVEIPKPAPAPAPAPTPMPAAAPKADFAREHSRHPFAKPVKLRCTSWEHLITLHARNLSRGGIFVKTASPLEMGTRIEVQLGLPDGRSLSLDAEVARVVAPERDGAEPPGMALRFLPMDDARKAIFEEALREAAAHASGPQPMPTPAARPRALSPDPIEESVLRDILADVARLREGRRHEVLGVPAHATPAVIRGAYVQLAMRHHPDLFVRYHSPLVIDAAIDAFSLVRQAYEQMIAGATPEPPAPAPAPAPAPSTPARSLLGEDLFADRPDTRPDGAAPPELTPSITQLAADGRDALLAGRYADARATLGRAIQIDPRDRFLRARFHLASAYEAKAAGRHDEAMEHFERVLVFDKACEEAIRELRAGAMRSGKKP